MPGDCPHRQFELFGTWPLPGRSWRYGRERIDQLISEQRVARRSTGKPFLKRYLADSPSQRPEEEDLQQAPLTVTTIVHEFTTALVRRLARSPQDLSLIEWRDLERVLAASCEGLGFETRLTRSGKDGGYDIELTAKDECYLVELKHWSAPSFVGFDDVGRFLEIVVTRDAARGLLLSSSGFRSRVFAQRVELSPQRVALGDGRKIIGLCQRYVETERGFWHPTSDLAELLFLDTY